MYKGGQKEKEKEEDDDDGHGGTRSIQGGDESSSERCLQDAFNGDAARYPFSSQKFNLSSIKQLVRGEEYPYETLELKHDDTSKDRRAYHRFLHATGSL